VTPDRTCFGFDESCSMASLEVALAGAMILAGMPHPTRPSGGAAGPRGVRHHHCTVPLLPDPGGRAGNTPGSFTFSAGFFTGVRGDRAKPGHQRRGVVLESVTVKRRQAQPPPVPVHAPPS